MNFTDVYEFSSYLQCTSLDNVSKNNNEIFFCIVNRLNQEAVEIYKYDVLKNFFNQILMTNIHAKFIKDLRIKINLGIVSMLCRFSEKALEVINIQC
jgi:hypothetical protein